MFHQINTAAFLWLPPAAGIQRLSENILQLFRQGFAAFGSGVKHLGAGILLLGKMILVDTQQQRPFRFPDGADTLL